MRITSGIAGGRTIRAPKGIRPTQDRVREAYFSKIAAYIGGCRFLDLYAGSGAVGIEAWSRGAAESLLVEKDRMVLNAGRQNAASLEAHSVTCVCARVEQFLARPAQKPYNLIYADPPYTLADEPGFAAGLLLLIEKGGWLAGDGILTLERRAGGMPADAGEPWRVLDSRKYGESALDFYCFRQ